MALDTIWFEVTYLDGTTRSEMSGLTYADINRGNLGAFRLRDGDGPVIELTPEDGRNGHNLVYRRRTILGPDGDLTKPFTVYILGWIPQGPVFAVEQGTFQIYQADSFLPGDRMFYPPQPAPYEGWHVHNPTRIVNPTLERTT